MCGFIRKVRHTRGTITTTEACGLTTSKKLCDGPDLDATAALAFAGGGPGGGGGGGGSAPPSLPNLVLTLLPGGG